MTSNEGEGLAYVYILACADGSYYTGFTTDIERRLKAHNSAHGAAYTRSRRPVRLIYCEEFPTPTAARKREAAIKSLSRQQKEALIKGLLPSPGKPL